MKNILPKILLTGLIISTCHALTFMNPMVTGSSVTIDEKQPICFYIMHGYRPITPSAIKAVMAAGTKTCSDKAEVYSYKLNGTGFVKLNKTKLGASKYNAIKKQYMTFLVNAGRKQVLCHGRLRAVFLFCEEQTMRTIEFTDGAKLNMHAKWVDVTFTEVKAEFNYCPYCGKKREDND